ncbi:MAG: 30S ribosomal protein S14 [Bacteroides sp.]|nr:30S ribosomal protein S14 [Bacteroides sp.]MCM1414034.1 30S ribosomal protein S14 [Bacteroides sp.]MCM1472271.1 30S ribosomal protein S14 [Bacteroides sp.]
MAKESMKAREVKRAKLVAKYAKKREELKKIVNSGVNEENRAEAYEAAQKLQSLPKNSNPIRVHNRCTITGRPKGYMRQFGLSRIQFREMASAGLIPGVKKASW